METRRETRLAAIFPFLLRKLKNPSLMIAQKVVTPLETGVQDVFKTLIILDSPFDRMTAKSNSRLFTKSFSFFGILLFESFFLLCALCG
jgi:hypothetical protein